MTADSLSANATAAASRPPKRRRTSTSEPRFQIRVITAELAQQHRDITTIPLGLQKFELNVALRDLSNALVGQFPGCILPPLELEGNECNCSLARALVDASNVKLRAGTEDATPGRKFLLLYSNALTKLVGLGDETAELPAVTALLRMELGGEFQINRHVEIWQGHSPVPIVTVCSATRHKSDAASSTPSIEVERETRLDLHTAELPIATPRTDLTVDELGLNDSIVHGVLNLYAVVRKGDATGATNPPFNGKAEIYLAGPHWVRT
jgi:hypothetical protein